MQQKSRKDGEEMESGQELHTFVTDVWMIAASAAREGTGDEMERARRPYVAKHDQRAKYT